MATTTATKAASARTAAAEAAVNAPEVQVKGVTRREFLFYIWSASIALLLGELGGAIVWFALPRFREGEYGGKFPVDTSTLPAANSAPVLNPVGKYWISNTDRGLLALSATCTHLGCLFKWVDLTNRFECPCHGSKFEGDGTYIEGPAPRSLDRFELEIDSAGGTALTDANGGPLAFSSPTAIRVNTGKKIKGASHA
jgi:cytochrome b6-f complex iron-sulfur subunit